MSYGDDRPPTRKVVYSELKPDCRATHIMLMECGHILEVNTTAGVPKKKMCYSCKYPKETLGQIFLEWRELETLILNWSGEARKKKMQERSP